MHEREILFRGKRLGNREWVYGYYVHIPCGRFNKDEHLIQTIKDDGRIGSLVSVDSTTVGQFSGLTDKNGVKIFEGDVMHFYAYGFLYVGVVYIIFGNACILCGDKASPFLDHAIEKYGAEVIGNKFDNPELLGGNDETD